MLVWTGGVYDANDNPVGAWSPHYGQGDIAPSTIPGAPSLPLAQTTFDAMDRATAVTSPRKDGTAPIVATTLYDAAGRVTTSLQPKGQASAATHDFRSDATYDKLDRIATTTLYATDSAGARITTEDRTSLYCYDLAGDLRSVTGPKANNPAVQSCPPIATGAYTPITAGFTGKFEYDFAHRQIKTTDPAGNYTKTAYNENGAPTSVVDWVNLVADEAARTTTFTYSSRGEKTQQVSPFNGTRKLTTQWQYDALGNVSKTISPRAYDTNSVSPTDFVQTMSYDELNRPWKVKLPTDASTPQAYQYTAYDKNGQQTLITLPTTNGSLAGPSAVVATAFNTNQYTLVDYWDTGQIYSSTDPANPRVRFGYTAEGWQSQRISEQNGLAGQLDLTRSMFWDYLPDGLLVALRDIGGQRASYAYDANGNRTQVNEANGITQAQQQALNITAAFTGFNELKAVTSQKFGVSGCTQTSSFAFDLHGSLSTLAENAENTGCPTPLQAARSFTYAYDSTDRLTGQTDDARTTVTTDDEQWSFIYRPAGWLDTRTLTKGTAPGTQDQKSVRTYFDNGQLQTLKNYDGLNALIEDHTLTYTTGTGAGIYQNGNRVGDTFKRKQADGTATCWTATCAATWAYDGRDRLVSENDGTPSATTTTFTLDVIGNTTQEVKGSTTTTRAYTGQQLTSSTTGTTVTRYVYDPYGNTDCVVQGSWAAATCPTVGNAALLVDNIYDYANRLAATRSYDGTGSSTPTDSADYVNDPLDRPVQETEYHAVGQTSDATKGWEAGTTTSKFTYLGISNAVTQETAVNGANTKVREHSYDGLGFRSTLSEKLNTGTPTRYSYLYDPHSSVSLLLDQTANPVKASYGYSAYGSANATLTTKVGGFTPTTNPYRYTAKRFDTGSGTYDMGARRYAPGTGRFLQYDQYSGGLNNLGLSLDPFSQNRYAFTGANPVNRIEIDGHSSFAGGCLDCEGEDPSDQRTVDSANSLDEVAANVGNGTASDADYDEAEKQKTRMWYMRLQACDTETGGACEFYDRLWRAWLPFTRPMITWDKISLATMFIPGGGGAIVKGAGLIIKGAKGLSTAVRAEKVASTAANTVARACANSFSGDTFVLMAYGSKKPISDVKLGDQVIATDPETGKSGPRKVIDLIQHGGWHTMVAVRLSDGTMIHATGRHPFWVADGGHWVDAIDLETGDNVVASDGRRIAVVAVSVRAEDMTAYNLTIDGLHTYYVGRTPVLVHNAGGCTSLADLPARAVRNLTEDAAYAFQRLRLNHGVTRVEFREQLHALKKAWDLPADFNVRFGPTGDVWNPRSGDLLGRIVHGG